MDVAKLLSHHSQTVQKLVPWELKQTLLATVISSNKPGKLHLQIDGKAYNFKANTTFELGNTLMFKVVSLFPQIQLEHIKSSRNIQSVVNPVVILSSQHLQKTQHASTRNNSSLLSLIQSFGLSTLQPLPTETLALLSSLKKALVKSKDLSNAGKLRPALQNSGLMLESKLRAKGDQHKSLPDDFSSDLKAILFKILGSLNNKGTPREHAVLTYSNNIPNSKRTKIRLLHSVQDALSTISTKQEKTLDEIYKGNQSWFFELPVNSPSQSLSIPIKLSRDTANNDASSDAPWQAEFSIDLKNCGLINVAININNMSVSVLLNSESNETVQNLREHSDTLNDNLKNGGLMLSAFSSKQLNSGLPNV